MNVIILEFIFEISIVICFNSKFFMWIILKLPVSFLFLRQPGRRGAVVCGERGRIEVRTSLHSWGREAAKWRKRSSRVRLSIRPQERNFRPKKNRAAEPRMPGRAKVLKVRSKCWEIFLERLPRIPSVSEELTTLTFGGPIPVIIENPC